MANEFIPAAQVAREMVEMVERSAEGLSAEERAALWQMVADWLSWSLAQSWAPQLP